MRAAAAPWCEPGNRRPAATIQQVRVRPFPLPEPVEMPQHVSSQQQVLLCFGVPWRDAASQLEAAVLGAAVTSVQRCLPCFSHTLGCREFWMEWLSHADDAAIALRGLLSLLRQCAGTSVCSSSIGGSESYLPQQLADPDIAAVCCVKGASANVLKDFFPESIAKGSSARSSRTNLRRVTCAESNT